MTGDPGRLCALASGRSAAALTFLPVHMVTAVALGVVGAAICTLLLRTRAMRLAFLGGLTDGRQAFFADLFATVWLVAILFLSCGVSQLFLVTTYLGGPAWWQVTTTVLRGGIAMAAAARCVRVWRGLRGLNLS